MILFVAAMLACQEPDAAGAFRAFEEALAQAPTVVLKFKGRQEVTIGEAAPRVFEVSGELLLKGPGKARYRFRVGEQEILMTSDGTTLLVGGAGSSRRREAPADLRARFFEPSASRVGLVGVLAIPTGYAGKEVEDRRAAFTCSKFQSLEPESGCRRIRYEVKVSPSGRTFETTLSLDPLSGLPRRRTLLGQDARSKSVVTEDYEPCLLGSDIEDGAFALPK